LSEIAKVARLQDVSSEIADFDRPVARATDTPTAAFEHLYAEHRVAVLRFLAAFTCDNEKALELASVTFERAWSECRAGREIGLGWLLRSARNVAIDVSRRDAVRERFSRLRPAPPFATSAEDIVIQRNSGQVVRAAVAKLPSPQREAVVLRFTSKLRVREIAEIIGKGEDATEKLLSRAMTTLREELHERV
jgi:RNA polymerase sigma-70 factor (ECF subfamily)